MENNVLVFVADGIIVGVAVGFVGYLFQTAYRVRSLNIAHAEGGLPHPVQYTLTHTVMLRVVVTI